MADLQQIQCPHCAAPVSQRGGKEIRSIVCAHCGTCLDNHDAFAAYNRFLSRNRPDVPVELGMEGTFKGARFTAIGLVEYTQRDMSGSYPWTEILLFSPTHGYAWLCREAGHWVFGREVKYAPENTPVGFSDPIFKTHLRVQGMVFKVFECATADLTYAEGELTWSAEHGRVEYVDAVAPPHLYGAERSANEIEYFRGEYLQPEEVYKAFGIKEKPSKPKGVFSCQPFSSHPLLRGLAEAAQFYTLLSGVLLLVTVFFLSGRVVFGQNVEVKPETESSVEFTVTESKSLVALRLDASLDNAWADFDVTIEDDDGEDVYGFTPQLSYYHGWEGGESWSEGSTHADTYFKVPEPGTYRLTIAGEGGTGDYNADNRSVLCGVRIKEGVKVSRYFVGLFALMLCLSGAAWYEKHKFERVRWADYYEELEEDD